MNKEQKSKTIISSSYSSKMNSNLDEEISLRDIIFKFRNWWYYLLSRWIIIVLSGLFGGFFGFLYAYNDKPVYTATTSFVLEEDNNGSGGMLGQLGGLAGIAGIEVGNGGGLFQGDNIIELYKSRNMVEKALLSKIIVNGKEQLLIDRYIEFNDLRRIWINKKELKNINFDVSNGKEFSRVQDSIMGETVKAINKANLIVSRPDKKLSIIKVEVKAGDELFAKEFNNHIVKTVNNFYIRTKTKKSLENLAILQHQTDSVRGVLDSAIYRTAAVADATPNLNPIRQVLRTPALRSQFNAEANKAILTQLVQNLELAKLSLRKEKPLIQLIDVPVYPLEIAKFGKLRGLLIGGILAGIFTVLLLIIQKIYVQILNEE